MRIFLKLSMVLDIDLMTSMKNNIFQKTRIKLTLYYITIMAFILIAFSSVLIFTVESKIRQGFKDRIVVTESEDNPAQRTSDEIELIIYMIDGVLLVGIGFVSYFLAGKTLNPIKEALDAQKKFSADASHDLRTPLAIMMTESEVVLQNKTSEVKELREIIQSNLDEAKKMSKLVTDLLLVSRGEEDSLSDNFISVDLHSFIEKIVQKFIPQAKDKNLTLEVSRYQKLDVLLDPSSFERAFSNILQNAINYTKQGGIKIDITEDRKNIILSVRDTGVGISQTDLPFVFDRFYKAEHSRNDTSGSGLGLSIVKQIVKKHKGVVTIESDTHTGTTVTIQLAKL